MMIAFIRQQLRSWRSLALLALLALGLMTACSTAAVKADNQLTPQFRDQVLQVIRENPEVILESVRTYQKKQQEQREQSRQSFLNQTKTNPKQVIASSPTTGAANGKVLLVEFSDFQCPYCAKAHDSLQQFMAKNGNTVTLTYKHFPLTTIHPEALPAAKAAWAAAQQGKFWPFHDALFSNQDKLGDGFYQATAQKLGLDQARFNRDRASKAADDAIQQDIELGEKIGVEGTPFFVMNGEAFSGAVQVSDLEETLKRVGG